MDKSFGDTPSRRGLPEEAERLLADWGFHTEIVSVSDGNLVVRRYRFTSIPVAGLAGKADDMDCNRQLPPHLLALGRSGSGIAPGRLAA